MAVNIENVQGNILKSFGKPNILLLFFEFKNPDNAKNWLREIAEKLPNTQTVIDAGKSEDKTWLHVSLSAIGIKKLGLSLPPSRNPSHPEDGLVEDGDPFTLGMKARSSVLGDTGDSGPQQWLPPFNSNVVDGVLIIASDIEDEPKKTAEQIKASAHKMEINFVGEQKGKGRKNEAGKDIEHFGFRDGVSQPLIKGINDDKIQKLGDKLLHSEQEDFVLSGLGGDLSWANEGSFLVYRRLRQDVDGFWDFMNDKSGNLGMSPEKLAAKFVGRWKSGAPLDKHEDFDPNDPKAADDNDFIYMDDDKEGLKTPRFSHIRKTFPRGDGVSNDVEENKLANNRHRMLRRGIPYGTEKDTDKGLLFMCYQKNLAMQFEFVQKMWSNNPNFPRSDGTTNHGHDAIIGQHHGQGFVNLLKEDGKFERINGFAQWVFTTAGEYFFSPSISSLKNL